MDPKEQKELKKRTVRVRTRPLGDAFLTERQQRTHWLQLKSAATTTVATTATTTAPCCSSPGHARQADKRCCRRCCYGSAATAPLLLLLAANDPHRQRDTTTEPMGMATTTTTTRTMRTTTTTTGCVSLHFSPTKRYDSDSYVCERGRRRERGCVRRCQLPQSRYLCRLSERASPQ